MDKPDVGCRMTPAFSVQRSSILHTESLREAIPQRNLSIVKSKPAYEMHSEVPTHNGSMEGEKNSSNSDLHESDVWALQQSHTRRKRVIPASWSSDRNVQLPHVQRIENPHNTSIPDCHNAQLGTASSSDFSLYCPPPRCVKAYTETSIPSEAQDGQMVTVGTRLDVNLNRPSIFIGQPSYSNDPLCSNSELEEVWRQSTQFTTSKMGSKYSMNQYSNPFHYHSQHCPKPTQPIYPFAMHQTFNTSNSPFYQMNSLASTSYMPNYPVQHSNPFNQAHSHSNVQQMPFRTEPEHALREQVLARSQQPDGHHSLTVIPPVSTSLTQQRDQVGISPNHAQIHREADVCVKEKKAGVKDTTLLRNNLQSKIKSLEEHAMLQVSLQEQIVVKMKARAEAENDKMASAKSSPCKSDIHDPLTEGGNWRVMADGGIDISDYLTELCLPKPTSSSSSIPFDDEICIISIESICSSEGDVERESLPQSLEEKVGYSDANRKSFGTLESDIESSIAFYENHDVLDKRELEQSVDQEHREREEERNQIKQTSRLHEGDSQRLDDLESLSSISGSGEGILELASRQMFSKSAGDLSKHAHSLDATWMHPVDMVESSFIPFPTSTEDVINSKAPKMAHRPIGEHSFSMLVQARQTTTVSSDEVYTKPKQIGSADLMPPFNYGVDPYSVSTTSSLLPTASYSAAPSYPREDISTDAKYSSVDDSQRPTWLNIAYASCHSNYSFKAFSPRFVNTLWAADIANERSISYYYY